MLAAAGRQTLAKRPWLYFVTPSLSSTDAILPLVAKAIKGGANIIQLRNKTWPAEAPELLAMATALRDLTRAHDVPFLVNDHVALALEVGADGAHIGQEDTSVADAKALLAAADARDFILGVTVRDATQATIACQAGASYLGVGPVYSSSTKAHANNGETIGIRGLESVVETARAFHVPVVAIGGIDASRVQGCMQAGTAGVAVVAAISSAADVTSASTALYRNVALYHRALV
ncbi:thiamine-phosphate pyrophosphorylase [Saprolegnia parasitica CBS 223.65]|uniref:thiamine phosphate synthase n=1 Tax=Saprolegnia parasitica (strain CBS 223.65) TaxID=695850 RepID=A0A067CF84_SAPPC|nr:thiamine-phosphate pyrophosphorylase [Saprolegnia parasitica CBS 223.65]KDO27840.1 thiamine-phosphate pyrophosphorylase [Saprolegnia parasitica CBS 223.65]|eukprot:XP_012201300.1 thiamine-phosphate pyrophosphorylase [Saprolegnia parasitica CBS 223.65]